MTIQKAVLKGTLASLVQTRNIFTAEVIVIPGDEIEDYWAPYLHSIMDNVVNFTTNLWSAYEVDVYEYSGGQWIPFDSMSYSGVGTITGDYLPNSVAAVLLGKAAGLRHVGRKFFSGVGESVTAANTLAGSAITNAALALVAYITPLTTVLGTELRPGVVDAAGGFHPFTGGVVCSLLGSMRRRKPGIGI